MDFVYLVPRHPHDSLNKMFCSNHHITYNLDTEMRAMGIKQTESKDKSIKIDKPINESV